MMDLGTLLLRYIFAAGLIYLLTGLVYMALGVTEVIDDWKILREGSLEIFHSYVQKTEPVSVIRYIIAKLVTIALSWFLMWILWGRIVYGKIKETP